MANYNAFTDSDKSMINPNPAIVWYRDYGSSGAFTKALFANGVTFQKNVESTAIEFDDVGTVQEEVSTETVDISFDSGRILDMDFVADVSGGMSSVTAVAGTLVSGATYTAASGDWLFDKFILLPGQNANGSKQTIATVVGSVDGALVAGTDYEVVNMDGLGWGITIHDSVTVTTEAQNVIVTYAYTPAVQKIMKTGGNKVIGALEVKFETIDADGKAVIYDFYKVYPNGSFGHGFSPENSSEPITMPMAFVAKKDTNRSVGDQLFSVTRNY
jgi:hypothetical protein